MPTATTTHFHNACLRTASSRRGAIALTLLLSTSVAGCDKKDSDTDQTTSESAAGAEGASTDDASLQEIPAFTGTVSRLLRFEGEAGYDEPSMAAFGDACIAGQVPEDPQHTFQVDSLTAIEFIVRGEDDDLSLVIDGPGGPYCNDDYDGLDAGMQLELQPGEYSVFIGTYSDEPLDPTPAYTFVIKDPEGSEPRHPVLSLLDTRLDELIQTAEPTQKQQLERLQVMLGGIGHSRGGAIEVQSVDDLKRMLGRLNLSDAEQAEVSALIERLESEAGSTQAEENAPDDNSAGQ